MPQYPFANIVNKHFFANFRLNESSPFSFHSFALNGTTLNQLNYVFLSAGLLILDKDIGNSIIVITKLVSSLV